MRPRVQKQLPVCNHGLARGDTLLDYNPAIQRWPNRYRPQLHALVRFDDVDELSLLTRLHRFRRH